MCSLQRLDPHLQPTLTSVHASIGAAYSLFGRSTLLVVPVHGQEMSIKTVNGDQGTDIFDLRVCHCIFKLLGNLSAGIWSLGMGTKVGIPITDVIGTKAWNTGADKGTQLEAWRRSASQGSRFREPSQPGPGMLKILLGGGGRALSPYHIPRLAFILTFAEPANSPASAPYRHFLWASCRCNVGSLWGPCVKALWGPCWGLLRDI